MTFLVDGGWSKWSSWARCNATCVGGIQVRTRTCYFPVLSYYGSICTGDMTDIRNCNSVECPGIYSYIKMETFVYAIVKSFGSNS